MSESMPELLACQEHIATNIVVGSISSISSDALALLISTLKSGKLSHLWNEFEN